MKNRHTQRQNISYEILYRKLVYHRGSIVHCDNADQDTHVIYNAVLGKEEKEKGEISSLFPGSSSAVFYIYLLDVLCYD